MRDKAAGTVRASVWAKNQSSYWKNYEKKKKKRVDPVLSDDVINMKEVTDICFVQ